MRTNMLHSNLLGRLGNGLLKFVVLVVMVCNVSGAFATTFSENQTYSEPITIIPLDDVIVNPGVTLTINSEVTIQGNLINNGGTIIVGEGGVLTVTGNVTNTSAYSTTEYTNSSPSPDSPSYSDQTEWSEIPGSNPRTRTRTRNETIRTTITGTPVFCTGTFEISNGGKISIKGDFTNKATMTVTSTDASKISSVSINGTFTNNDRTTFTGKKKITTTTTKTPQTQTQTRKNGSWTPSSPSWVDGASSSDNSVSEGDNVSSSTIGLVNLSNGYLVVKGSMELQDNSVINYNTASSLGEDIQSTINVSGSVTQAENADINLASGAKGKLIVAETYTDNTTTEGNANHPWSITDDGELVMNSGFDLYAKKYVSAKLDAIENEIDALIASLNTQLTALTGMSLDDYLASLNPEDYNKYQTGGHIVWLSWRYYRDEYDSYSEYVFKGGGSWFGGLGDWLNTLGKDYNTFLSNLTTEKAAAIAALQTQIDENTTLKATFEALEQALASEGVNSTSVSTQSAAVSALLPIELTSFSATATNNGFAFNWVTASEVENDYFTLEYSINGVDFNEIDYVHGAGTTSETSEYTYRWDEAPEFDVVYFRLKQTDYNGEYSYSDVIAASRKKSSGANGTFRYGPLNLQIQDGELRYIVK